MFFQTNCLDLPKPASWKIIYLLGLWLGVLAIFPAPIFFDWPGSSFFYFFAFIICYNFHLLLALILLNSIIRCQNNAKLLVLTHGIFSRKGNVNKKTFILNKKQIDILFWAPILFFPLSVVFPTYCYQIISFHLSDYEVDAHVYLFVLILFFLISLFLVGLSAIIGAFGVYFKICLNYISGIVFSFLFVCNIVYIFYILLELLNARCNRCCL